MTSFLGIGVWAGTVAAFNLLKAFTICHPHVAFRKQKVGEICVDVDSLTLPAAKRSAKNLSIASTCSRGSGYCFMTHYFEPGFRSISWRVPLSLVNSHGIASGNTSLNFIKSSKRRFALNDSNDWLIPCLLIKDTLVHWWATENPFTLDKDHCRSDIT